MSPGSWRCIADFIAKLSRASPRHSSVFFEFSIRALVAHLKIKPEDEETAWKPISTQSERQLGAFFFTYLAVLKRPFVDPTLQKMTEFRNSVVHKGHIPNRKETLTYAKQVFEIVKRVRIELAEHDPEALAAVELRTGLKTHRAALERKADLQTPAADGQFYGASSMHFNMMLSEMGTSGLGNFEKSLAFSETMLDIWGP